MKKSFVLAALILVGILFGVTAQDAKREYKYPFQESEISYHNVIVYKVLDQKESYIVLYAKGHNDVGTVKVPKEWYSSAVNPEAKLTFRALPKGMTPYMTVISRGDSFERVIMTLPTSRAESVWGVADSGTNTDSINSVEQIVY